MSWDARHDLPPHVLAPDTCRDLLARLVKLRIGGGDVELYVRSAWSGNVRWARNTIISSGDTTNHEIVVTRVLPGNTIGGSASTNRLDDASLLACIRQAEGLARAQRPFAFAESKIRPTEAYQAVSLWSDATAGLGAAARATVQRSAIQAPAAAGLLSAGYLEVSAAGNGVLNSAGLFAYVPETRAECSITVRNTSGTASGWAGQDHLDWGHLDAGRLTEIALDKCRRSVPAEAIEPGRYTVILEPQAVADLLFPLIVSLERIPAEMGDGPWAFHPEHAVTPEVLVGSQALDEDDIKPGGGGGSKIGMRVMDERVTIAVDPTDPDMPLVPFAKDATRVLPVTWIERGVLRNLAYSLDYALSRMNRPDPIDNTRAFRMSGDDSSIAAMIAATERGLLVTRFANVRQLDLDTLLQAGTTADGLWLIEHGKITTPVKNFRFRESPLFALNNLEALGAPVRVLMDRPTIVPPIKVRDFSMTSLADSV